MNLRKLFLLNTLVFGLLGAGMALALIFFTDHLRTSADGIEVAIRSVHAVEKLQIALLSYDREIARNLPRPEELKKIMIEAMKQVSSFADTEEERNLVDIAYKDIFHYMDSPPGHRKEELRRANDVLNKLVSLNLRQSDELQAQMYRGQLLSDSLGLGCLALLFLAAVVIAILQRFNVWRPLTRLRAKLYEFSQAPFSAIKVQPEGVAEIRDISKVVNEMSSTLIRQRESQFKVLAAIAHDLRNPLNGIKMSVDLLSENDTPEERGEVLEIVRRQAVHLDRLVGDLLDTTRIEAGDISLKPQLIDLREPVHEATLLFKNTSECHSLKVHVPDSPVWTKCDPLRISQVLNNLLSNAIKYSPDGGVIEVDLDTETLEGGHGRAHIRVTDEGIGIAPADVGSVFEPFHRTAVTRDAFPGVGLGLSAARKIIEAHDGKIVIEANRPRGTCFRVILPSESCHCDVGLHGVTPASLT
jgi:signal transduction histidine kinase